MWFGGQLLLGALAVAGKAAQFLGNLAKKSERNGRNGNPRKSDSDTAESGGRWGE